MAGPRRMSKEVRAQRYGLANQIGYEAQQTMERNALRERLENEHREARARGAKALARKKDGTGMNAGTIGRARF